MQVSQLCCSLTNIKASLRGRWLNTLTKIKFWYYLWISIIHAILKLQSMKNLELLIACSSRATNKYVEASISVNRAMVSCLSTSFVFSILIGLKFSTCLAQNMKSGWCTTILDSPLNVGTYFFPIDMSWQKCLIPSHGVLFNSSDFWCPSDHADCQEYHTPRPKHVHRLWLQSVHAPWGITGLCVRSVLEEVHNI